MNLLLLEAGESGTLIPSSDRRHEHLRRVLKKGPGDFVAAGIITESAFGPAPASLGRAFIRRLDREGLVLDFEPGQGPLAEAPVLAPLRLLLGFPRPIQATRIFKDLVSLGLGEIQLTGTELGEKSYLESTFFRDREYRRPLLDGAEQAGNPRLPGIGLNWTLTRALAALEGPEGNPWSGSLRIALHPDETRPFLGRCLAGLASPASITLAVGSERGWTGAELDLLKEAGFIICGLGERILKTETAAVAASALALASLSRM